MHGLVGQFVHDLGVPAAWLGHLFGLPTTPTSLSAILAGCFVAELICLAYWALLQYKTHPAPVWLGLYGVIVLTGVIGSVSSVILPYAWLYAAFITVILLIVLPWLYTLTSDRSSWRWNISLYYCALVFALALPLTHFFATRSGTLTAQKANHTALDQLQATIATERTSVSTLAQTLSLDATMQTLLSKHGYAELSTYLQTAMLEHDVQSIVVTDANNQILVKAGQPNAVKEDLTTLFPSLSTLEHEAEPTGILGDQHGNLALLAIHTLATPFTEKVIVTKTLDSTWLNRQSEALHASFALSSGKTTFLSTATPQAQRILYGLQQDALVQSDIQRLASIDYSHYSSLNHVNIALVALPTLETDAPLALLTLQQKTVFSRKVLLSDGLVVILSIGVPFALAWLRRRRYQKGKA